MYARLLFESTQLASQQRQLATRVNKYCSPGVQHDHRSNVGIASALSLIAVGTTDTHKGLPRMFFRIQTTGIPQKCMHTYMIGKIETVRFHRTIHIYVVCPGITPAFGYSADGWHCCERPSRRNLVMDKTKCGLLPETFAPYNTKMQNCMHLGKPTDIPRGPSILRTVVRALELDLPVRSTLGQHNTRGTRMAMRSRAGAEEAYNDRAEGRGVYTEASRNRKRRLLKGPISRELIST